MKLLAQLIEHEQYDSIRMLMSSMRDHDIFWIGFKNQVQYIMNVEIESSPTTQLVFSKA